MCTILNVNTWVFCCFEYFNRVHAVIQASLTLIPVPPAKKESVNLYPDYLSRGLPYVDDQNILIL